MAINELWYDKEAANWDEALPLGNGRMGAMVFSGVKQERFALNDDTLWSGFPQSHEVEGAAEYYKKARDLSLAGKYDEAQDIIEKNCLGENSQRYLPLGDLILEMPEAHGVHTGYQRKLDIKNATLRMRYIHDNVCYRRHCFISAPDRVMVIKIWGDEPGCIHFKARFDCQLTATVTARDNRLSLEGQAPPTDNPAPAQQGMAFVAVADFENRGGTVRTEGDTICVENVDAIVIRMAWRTNFTDAFTPPMMGGVLYLAQCAQDLHEALKEDYLALHTRHLKDYHALFNRVDIRFHGENKERERSLPQRLANWETAENDPALFALLFQYGRYLMIAGSRPGTRPLTLQGIWNPHLYAPWNSNYTININTEMNYWPADVTNLAECQQPLFDFLAVLRENGQKTAKIQYDARGFAVHHNSDIWGMTTPVEYREGQGVARWAFWPLAGGWFCAHAYNHYLYTRNTVFLKETAWPLLRDAARFFMDVLVEDGDGFLVFAPSTSPENDFAFNGKPLSVCKTTTMTTAIIKETLTNTIHCIDHMQVGDIDAPNYDIKNFLEKFRAEVEGAFKKLPPYTIGSRGELLEWSEELPEHEPTHRHTSHLYPLYPGYEIEAGTPLAAACKKTLDLREDESTGWALAWRINLFARLRDAERAFSFLKKQLRPCEGRQGGCYPNLFGSHPPFQIDSNFGATAGIAEMLLQSKPDGTIYLLPALPKALGSGHVVGLRAMGGVTVNMHFEAGELQTAELTLDAGREMSERDFTVIYKDTRKTLQLNPYKTTVFHP